MPVVEKDCEQGENGGRNCVMKTYRKLQVDKKDCTTLYQREYYKI